MTEVLSSSPSLVDDSLERERALDIRESFCVSAPAGSGKTELLTQRFLKLLADVDQPDKILAITFTRKAAAEMRARLLAALYEAKAMHDEGDFDDILSELEPHKKNTLSFASAVLKKNHQLNWALIENPGQLRIQTIDSLCNAIAVGEPVASRLGGPLRPVDDASLLYASAVDDYLQQIKSISPENTEHPLRELLDYFYGRQYLLRDLLMSMLPVRDQWLHYVGELIANHDAASANQFWLNLESFLNRYIEECLESLKAGLQPYVGTITELVQHGLFHLEKNHFSDCKSKSRLPNLQMPDDGGLPKATVANLDNWLAILELFFVDAGTARKAIGKDIGFPADASLKGEDKSLNKSRKALLKATAAELFDQDELRELVNRVRSLPSNLYSDASRSILVSIAHCLRELAAHLYLRFSETGSCDHAEMQSAALRALGWGDSGMKTAVAYQWHRSIQHLLVDEFQDTSVSQFRLIEALTSEWGTEQDQAAHARTLFVVGDGMQSIYAFRQAKVGLFLRARQQGIGSVHLTPLQLSQNFRSSKNIVDWVNQQFGQSFPSTADWTRGAVSYSASKTAREAQSKDKPAVEIQAFVDDSQEDQIGSDDLQKLEADVISSEIEDQLASTPDCSIAVLVRSKKHAVNVIQAFNERDIDWVGVEMFPLKDREVVLDAVSLYRACANPVDDIAWWALLRAPWAGITLSDLQQLHDLLASDDRYAGLSDWLLCTRTYEALENGELLRTGLSKDACLRLKIIVIKLQTFWKDRCRQPLRQTVYALWSALGGDAVAGQSVLGDDRLSVEAFFDLLEQLDSEQRMGGAELSADSMIQKLDKLFAGTDIRSSNSNPVQIMTIHKSKGLEFDMVVLPALERRSRVTDLPILASRELVYASGGEGVALSPRPQTDLLKNVSTRAKQSSVYEFLREEQKQAEAYEADRLFYVACTRAKKRLLLTTCPGWDGKKGQIKQPGKGSLLYPHWGQLVNTEQVDVIRMSSSSANRDIDSACDEFCQLPLRRFRSAYYLKGSVLNNQKSGAGEDVQSTFNFPVLSNEEDSQPDQNIFERAAGVLFHDVMERWHQQLQTNIDSEWLGLSSLLEQYLAWRLDGLLQENRWRLTKQDRVEVCRLVGTACERIQGSELMNWLFRPGHTFSHSELSLNFVEVDQYTGEQNGTRLLRIDRTFIDEDQCRWIIDFKLLAASADRTAEEAFNKEEQAALIEQYREQLSQYCKAIERYDSLQGLTPASTRCALYLPLTDQLVVC